MPTFFYSKKFLCIRTIIHIFIFILLFSNVRSQTGGPYNVYTDITKESNDTLKVIGLCKNFKAAISLKEFNKADLFFSQALELSQSTRYPTGFVNLISIIDDDLISVGNYRKGIEYLFKLKKSAEEVHFYYETSAALNMIGVIYWQQGDPTEALVFYNENLDLIKRTKINGDLSASYNNIGLAYRSLNQNKKAVAFYVKSLQGCLANDNLYGVANAYNNIGTIYQIENDFERALYYHKKALEIRLKIGDSIGISMSFGNLGFTNLELKNNKEAFGNLTKAYGISKRLNDPEGVKETSEGLSHYYELENDPGKALAFYKEFVSTRDSLTGQEVKKELLIKELEFKYEKENQKKTIEAAAEKKRQQQYTYMVLIILFIVLVFSFILFRRFKLTQRQKAIIENQKKLVEEKQKAITDSIHYAKRIQTTLLPTEKYVEKTITRLNDQPDKPKS